MRVAWVCSWWYPLIKVWWYGNVCPKTSALWTRGAAKDTSAVKLPTAVVSNSNNCDNGRRVDEMLIADYANKRIQKAFVSKVTVLWKRNRTNIKTRYWGSWTSGKISTQLCGCHPALILFIISCIDCSWRPSEPSGVILFSNNIARMRSKWILILILVWSSVVLGFNSWSPRLSKHCIQQIATYSVTSQIAAGMRFHGT